MTTRYASREMAALFSSQFRHITWRKLWVALATAQKELGLPITDAQIKAMQAKIDQIDWTRVAELEKNLHHDVMAHITAFGEICPKAKGIIHLGATSTYVTDNTDLIQMREVLKILKTKLLQLIKYLATFAKKNASLATLSYTHLQPAQPTTVGKRACLWLQDFLLDYHEIEQRLKTIHFLGVKGATGTQASFLALFDGSAKKVKELEKKVARHMGFDQIFTISSQTYTRKQDLFVLSTLSGLAVSAHKFATDLRLLAHLKEMDEPFDEKQVGSSAMPHKRNPMRSERVCGLARFLISLNENPAYTAATQWLERTLDDSANRRIVLPEAFLTADALLNLLIGIVKGLHVYPKMIEANLKRELPFLALENILMAAVKKGGDRGLVHAALRTHSLKVSRQMKEEGKESDLLKRLSKDPKIGLSEKEIQACLKSQTFIGLAPDQVAQFLKTEVAPLF